MVIFRGIRAVSALVDRVISERTKNAAIGWWRDGEGRGSG